MSVSTLYKLCGWAAVSGGLIVVFKKLVIELFLPVNVATNAFGTVGLLLTFFSLFGVYWYQKEATGRLGLIGFLVNWFGIGLVAGVDYTRLYVFPFLSQETVAELLAGPTRTVFLISTLVFLSGVILFSIASLRVSYFPKLAILMYLIGFVPYSLSFLFPEALVRVAQVTGEIGIIWLGWTLVLAARETMSSHAGQPVPA